MSVVLFGRHQTPSPDTPSEHLQLYYHASRKFNEVFESQEQLSILHTYDKPAGVREGGGERGRRGKGEGGGRRERERM